jgi:ATP-dependent exoDNAse (exonuclease V) alpha subunit
MKWAIFCAIPARRKKQGLEGGQYARVQGIDAATNRLTVQLQNGTERTYDPRRQCGVSVFREEIRRFSVGDRIQFTSPANDLKIANRELGVITDIGGAERLNLTMDSGRSIEVDPTKHPHLDYGYTMTSHSSQGQTADQVLIHVDTELAAKDLLNPRMAYVSVSRGAFDAQIFTNNREKLPTALGHDVSKQTANALRTNVDQTIAPQQEISGPQQEHGTGLGISI